MQQAVSSRQENSIVKFTDLKAWQEGHKLVLAIYAITRQFPQDEQFALTSQLRRAAVSLTSNLAEGFSRQTRADTLHFYAMAQGSLTEVQSQLLIARDVDYVSAANTQKIADQTIVVHKLITGLMKALRAGRGASK